MGFCKSNQKNIPVVGFLTRNDCDVLRAKTGVYRWVTHRTIIPPTPAGSPLPKWHIFSLCKFFPLFWVTPGGLRGLGLKGGAVPPGVHLAIPPSPLMFPSTIMGTHTATFLVCATRVTSPPEVMSSPPAAWRVVCGCCFYEGLGHWLGVGGSFRSTLGSLRPLSGLCSLGKYQIFFLSFLLRQLVKFFVNIFSTFF